MRDFLKLTFLVKPNPERIEAFYQEQIKEQANFSLERQNQKIEKQTFSVQIGTELVQFQHAKQLIQIWRVFETPEGIPFPPDEAPCVGQTTINLLRVFKLWFLLACRITEVYDEPTRYGFRFETLPGHVECGWESFVVEYDETSNKVWYTISSESTHRFLLMKAASPVVHLLQRRYKRNSGVTIKRLLTQTIK